MKRKKLHDYQQGGAVRGPGTATSDSILARVSNGEYVLPKPAVDLAGVENLDALRSAALSGYASGGLVAGTGTYPAKRGRGLGRLGKMMGGEALESLLGIGPGVKGFAMGMTYSPEAQAQALDVTQTREYRNAQNAARQGQAPRFGFGEAPEAALQRMQQQQAVFDDRYRQMTGGPTPTEQRMLREMNQFNPRSMPGYAMGGEVNRFGYDRSLTNRMNSEADRMRDERTSNWRSPVTQPSTPEQPDFMSGLKSLINPQQQAQDVYKSARGKADPLDVASGRFDREYMPQYAAGGLVDEVRPYDEWQFNPQAVPGYADGGEIDLSRGLGVQFWERLNPEARARIQGAFAGRGMLAPEMARTATNQRVTPSGMLPPDQNVGAGMPAPNRRQPAAFMPQAFDPPNAAFSPPSATFNPPSAAFMPQAFDPTGAAYMAADPMAQPLPPPTRAPAPNRRQPAAFMPQAFDPPSAAVMAADPMAGRVPNPSRMLDPMAQRGRAQPLPTTPGPGAGGLTAINAAAGLPPMYTTGSRQVGTMPADTAYAPTGAVQGSAIRPRYETGYRDARGNTMTITGPSQRVGGGTLSVLDQGNGGTVEGNVAALDRQIAALRQLREARNPGITSGNVGGVRGFGKAGESFGDDVLARDRFMRQFQPPPGKRMTPKWAASIAAGQQAWDQGRLAPQQLAAQREQLAAQQKAALLERFLDMQNQAASRAFDQQKFSSQQEMDQRRFGLDTQRFGLDTQRLGMDQQKFSGQQDMDQRRFGLDTQRFGLDRQKAALETVRNRDIDQSRMEKDARIDPNDIKAALMQRYLQGGPDAAQAFDAIQKLFPNANPLAYLLASPSS